mmetsp:Transcript_4150/g.5215  ORF Transcript_4150/g.5215 Transcript_4150/m.5215 type:complete len:91 (+) Transcript_4150:1-273(+)
MAVIPWVYLFIFGQAQGCRIKQRIKHDTPLPEGENLEEASFALFNVSFFSAKNLRVLLAHQSQSFEVLNPGEVLDNDDLYDNDDDEEVIA